MADISGEALAEPDVGAVLLLDAHLVQAARVELVDAAHGVGLDPRGDVVGALGHCEEDEGQGQKYSLEWITQRHFSSWGGGSCCFHEMSFLLGLLLSLGEKLFLTAVKI